jgi:microcystin-dependent protein
LFTAIGTTWGAGDGSSTFALPDLEGAFLRGTGSNNTHNMADGNDYAGPSVGSFESDQNQSHTHTGNQKGPGGGSAAGLEGSVGDAGTWSTTSQGGDEARPFNAGVKYCIKY